jgi:hypothetical protein
MKALEERLERELSLRLKDGRLGKKELSSYRMNAILISIRLGKQLQIDIPWIAEDYRKGMFAREIVDENDITGKYGVSKNVAIAAVRYSIVGYEGNSISPVYQGLIKDKRELERLASEHHIKSGKKSLKEGKGRYSLTKEEKIAIGKKMYKDKKGIHRQTKKEREDANKKAIKALGFTLWIKGNGFIPDEIEYAHWLTHQEENTYSEGNHKGDPNLNSIKRIINEVYHNGNPVRTKRSIAVALSKYKKLKQTS